MDEYLSTNLAVGKVPMDEYVTTLGFFVMVDITH